jgi:hypothetical protein
LWLVRRGDFDATTRHPLFAAVAATVWLLSPQLLVIARFAVECTLMPLMMALQLVCVWQLIRKPGPRIALVDGVVVGLSVYVYHPLKIVPIVHFAVLSVAALVRWRSQPRLARAVALAGIVAALVMLPFLRDLFGAGHSLARFRLVNGHVDLRSLVPLYFAHFNPLFLFFHGDANLRHHYGIFGELNILMLPFALAGMVECAKRAWQHDLFALYLLVLVPACFLPAAVSDDGVPHALRSSAAVIPLFLLSVYGWTLWCRVLEGLKWRRAAQAATVVLVLCGLAQAIVGVAHYQSHYYRQSRMFWIDDAELARRHAANQKPPLTQHNGQSAFMRFFLVAEQHDYRYCAAPMPE